MLSRTTQILDRFSEWTGRAVSWLTLGIVLLGSFNAIARYLGRFTGTNLSSNAYIELQWYLFSVIFLLGAAYTLKHDAHVRVDVLYGRASARTKAWINVLGILLFLIPFSILMLWLCWPSVANSWAIGEISPDPGGLPRYIIKTAVPVAFVLLIIQAVSELLKQVLVLRGTEKSGVAADE